MTFTVKEIKEWSTEKNINGNWIPARPLSGPLSWKIKEAWLVLTGKLDTLKWEDQ